MRIAMSCTIDQTNIARISGSSWCLSPACCCAASKSSTWNVAWPPRQARVFRARASLSASSSTRVAPSNSQRCYGTVWSAGFPRRRFNRLSLTVSILARLFLAVAIVLPALSSTAAFGARAVAPWSGRLQIGDRAFVDADGPPDPASVCAFRRSVQRMGPASGGRRIAAPGHQRGGLRLHSLLGQPRRILRVVERQRGQPFQLDEWRRHSCRRDAGLLREAAAISRSAQCRRLAAHHSRGDLGGKQPAVPLARSSNTRSALPRSTTPWAGTCLRCTRATTKTFRTAVSARRACCRSSNH